MIGFSGGGDSLALLLDCVRHGPVHAVIVDHKLRADSRETALAAARLAAEHGATHEIVGLDWLQSPTGQAAWRRARLAALCAAARRLGAEGIALGHTQDDQAETVALRIAAGSGWRGLAGMSAQAPAPIWPEGRGLMIWRPLLAQSRAALRARLRAAGAHWIEDPANENLRFARVRARAKLGQAQGLRESLLRISALASHAASALDRLVWDVVGAEIVIDGGVITLRRACARSLPEPVQRRLMACLLTAASGQERLCNEVTAARSLHRLRMGESHTLSGARVRCLGGEAMLERDPGAVLGRGRSPLPLIEPLMPNIPKVWDNRLECMAWIDGWRIAPGRGGCPRMIHSDYAPYGLRIGDAAAPTASTALAAPKAEWLVHTRLRALLWRAGK